MLELYYDQKSPYLFFLCFESMYYNYLPKVRLFELRILDTIGRHYSIQKRPI